MATIRPVYPGHAAWSDMEVRISLDSSQEPLETLHYSLQHPGNDLGFPHLVDSAGSRPSLVTRLLCQ